jgi:hypothetical protein
MKFAARTLALTAIFALLGCVSIAQTAAPAGKWEDTSKDAGDVYFITSGANSKPILSEDYEVTQTHEVCASVYGYFMEKSQLGRYNVNFKGMRTSATFTFTTQYDAEHWVQKFCTPESLLSIKQGKGVFARNY